MNDIVVTFAVLAAVLLIHFSYVDFRFRYRGSVLWFWLAQPAPTVLWLSRAAIAACVLGALSIPIFGASKITAVVMIVLMVVHIGTLIAIERRDEEWQGPAGPPEL